ncbi:cytochrome P450 [Mycena rebaudengoi]|nr:cytochrome P450 [Mycena rebaudengoi]
MRLTMFWEWQLIQVLPTAVQVVARTSNRLFVGLPLCREPEYLQLNIDYAFAVFVRGVMINLLPGFVKPIFGPLLSMRKSSLRHALKFLGPLIDERLAKENEHGRDWPDRPNDLISWLLDFAEGAERTTPALALRVLFVNMSAIHTSSTAIAAALYDLVVHPEYILSMREEAECVVAEKGWTKAALGKMHKIDSFLRESQRRNNNGPITLPRIVVAKDGFTFSDGTTIPYGSFLSVAATVHFDPANYDRADVFDGFRFSRMREEFEGVGNDHPGERTSVFNRQMVSTAHDHLPFGHGCHVCPGRFFAAMELKAMLAHILANYDVKAETEGRNPHQEHSGSSSPSVYPGQVAPPEQRAQIADIRSQFWRLKSDIDALEKMEAELQTNLDQITYPVLTLPNEITSRIFVQCLPHGLIHPSPREAPLVLA